MTFQRRRGVPAKVYRNEEQTDSRGNVHKVSVPANPHLVKVWVYPQRSGRAEVPGQQQINVIRIGVRPDLEGVSLWSAVDMLGESWDVAAPPSMHFGASRSTRHWSIDLRRRIKNG